MPEFVDLLWSAASPMIKVLCICLAGTIGATETVGILTPGARATLAQIILFVFLPPFLFSTLVRAVSLESLAEWLPVILLVFLPSILFATLVRAVSLESLESLAEWWPIPLFVVFNAACGLLLGTVLSFWLLRFGILKEAQRGVFKAACTIGNVGQLPLALVSAACSKGLEKMALREGACNEDSTAMVSFGLAVGSILIWTAGPYLIRPPNDSREKPPNPLQAEMDVEAEIDQRSGLEWAGGGSARSNGALEGSSASGAAGRARDATLSAGRSSYKAARRILNPPIMACCAGVFCGSIPFLKNMFVGPSAPLGLLLDAMKE
ncbi:hypothetical protein T484DRAFT_1907829, partial [Baffinella frigidus]